MLVDVTRIFKYQVEGEKIHYEEYGHVNQDVQARADCGNLLILDILLELFRAEIRGRMSRTRSLDRVPAGLKIHFAGMGISVTNT